MKCSRIVAWAIASLLLCAPGSLRASDRAVPPESLLPADSVLFLRYQGMDKARAAYDKTAWADVMKGELGRLIDHVFEIATKTLTAEFERSGDNPQTRRLREFLPKARHLLRHLEGKGVMLAVELKEIDPPTANLMLILPQAGAPETKAGLDSLLTLISDLGGVKFESKTIQNREVKFPRGDLPMQIACWMEGEHFVIHVGTEKPEAIIARIDSGRGETAGLQGNPLFKQIDGFKAYARCADGFIDCRKCLDLVRRAVPPAESFIKASGLNALKSIQFHIGYQERMNRSTVLLEIDGPRTGLLQALMPASPFELSDLPPIPSDVTSVSVMEVDWAATYDLIKGIALESEKMATGGRGREVEGVFTGVNRFLGVDLRQDLLVSLGPKMAIYESPSEGFMFQGMVLVMEVKDESKLRKSLHTVVKQLAEMANVPVSIMEREYHGSHIHTVLINSPGFVPRPSFTFHKGWMAISLYPQPLKGFVLRSQEKLPTWKPTDRALRLVAAARESGSKLIGFSESDPRPTMRFLMSLAPTVGGFVQSLGNSDFDTFLIPNGQDVNRHLFPNVYLTLDDGGRIRYETYTSISLPSFLSAEGLPQWAMLSLGAMTFIGRSATTTFERVGGQIEVPAVPVAPPDKAKEADKPVERPVRPALPNRPGTPPPVPPKKDG